MVLAKLLCEVLGNYLGDMAQRRFSSLEDALTHLFWWEENFQVSKEGGNIISRGSCPIYKYYPKWCDEACMIFIERIAEKFRFKVERSKRQPQSNICEFIFRK